MYGNISVKFKVTLTNNFVAGAPYNFKLTVCHTAGHYGEGYDDCNY